MANLPYAPSAAKSVREKVHGNAIASLQASLAELHEGSHIPPRALREAYARFVRVAQIATKEYIAELEKLIAVYVTATSNDNHLWAPTGSEHLAASLSQLHQEFLNQFDPYGPVHGHSIPENRDWQDEVNQVTQAYWKLSSDLRMSAQSAIQMAVTSAQELARKLEKAPRAMETGAGNSAPPPADLKDWVLGELLGEGGQAFAYKASKGVGTEESVVKILKPWKPGESKASSDQDHRLRFRREVLVLRDLAELGCPGIVRLLEPPDLDPRDGLQPWYAMPYYQAGPMCRLDIDGKIKGWAESSYKGNLSRVLEIAEKVAMTLAFMHQRKPQVVHRDIHVGNIFFATVGGEPLVGDFGLAHYEFPGDTLQTGRREEFGPWRWRPPELTGGSSNQCNPKSDVYLLGGLIYEAISGGEFISVPEYPSGSFKHETSEYSLDNFTIDPRVAFVSRLLRNMLAADPAMRYTADDVAAACRAIRLWQSGKAEPLPSVSELESTAAEFRAKSAIYKETFVKAHLLEICNKLAESFGINEQSKPFAFHRQIAGNSGDGSLEQACRNHYPESAFAAIRVLVRFEPTPGIMLLGYAALIRSKDNQEIVAVIDEKGGLKEISRSFPDDPNHQEILKIQVREELKRLQGLAAKELRAKTL